jgi:hypothetical protein
MSKTSIKGGQREYKCPYFISAKHEGVISCELAKITPPDKPARNELLSSFCGGGDRYLECPFYRILDKYYKRKYDDWEGEK